VTRIVPIAPHLVAWLGTAEPHGISREEIKRMTAGRENDRKKTMTVASVQHDLELTFASA